MSDNCIKKQMIALMKKIAVKQHLTVVYKNKYGIKAINPCCSSVKELKQPEIIMDPSDLFLDVDYLTDEYTLLDKSILDSPHFLLMKALNEGTNIVTTEYYKRYSAGYLDERTAIISNKKKQQAILSTFEYRKKAILIEEYDPVSIYERHGKYYVYDGKHRAALCALLGKQVKCKKIENLLDYDGLVKRKVELMKLSKERFSKQLQFLDR